MVVDPAAAMTRRDTPAARAALARRRQRAAQSLKNATVPVQSATTASTRQEEKQSRISPLAKRAISRHLTPSRTSVETRTTAELSVHSTTAASTTSHFKKRSDNVIHYTASNKATQKETETKSSSNANTLSARRNRGRYRSASPSTRQRNSASNATPSVIDAAVKNTAPFHTPAAVASNNLSTNAVEVKPSSLLKLSAQKGKTTITTINRPPPANTTSKKPLMANRPPPAARSSAPTRSSSFKSSKPPSVTTSTASMPSKKSPGRQMSPKQKTALESKHRFRNSTTSSSSSAPTTATTTNSNVIKRRNPLSPSKKHLREVKRTTSSQPPPTQTPRELPPSPVQTPHLSTYLVDESFAETIADMTLHQLDTPVATTTTTTSGKFFSPPKENVLPPSTFGGGKEKAVNTSLLAYPAPDLQVPQEVDAACFSSHSRIMIRSCHTNQTISISQDDEEPQLSGLSLGRPQEVISLVFNTKKELRHGDRVRFALSSENAFLGVTHQLPLSLTLSEQPEEWTVLSATGKILVGRAAVTYSQEPMGAPIRSGQPVVLRHVGTGGVLSNDLTLLTDSCSSSSLGQDHMDRLQHHDQLTPSQEQMFQLIPAYVPPCPQWVVGSKEERIFLTGSYLLIQNNRNTENAEEIKFSKSSDSVLSQPMEALETTPQTMEKILMDQVIGSFLGLEGAHIQLSHASGKVEFVLLENNDIDKSLRNLVEQILPLSTYFARVQYFCSSHHPGYEYGRVMQAFAEGLDSLLQDYVQFVVQLEKQFRASRQTMKSIYFQITPSLHSMSILEHVCRTVKQQKGGALINALWSLEKLVYMGDTVAKKVLGILLEQSSKPYLEMMSAWLQSGELNDPYEEFMILRTREIDNGVLDGDAWMALFTMQPEHVLEGLFSDPWTKQKILTTGKYWNAVHACEDVPPRDTDELNSEIPKLPFNSDSSAILSYIDIMYQNASQVLVALLKNKFQLLHSLQVMKRYFLLDQADFCQHFLDAAEEELGRPSKEVSMGRVQNWLTMSIQQVEAHHREGEEGEIVPQTLRCRFSSKTLVSYLDSMYGGDMADPSPLTPSRNVYGSPTSNNTGMELFSIEFGRIPFPISLALSPKAMEQYKLLFRHLFFTKHVERRLIGVWRDHQILKKLDGLRGLMGPTFLLRQRMLHFVQNFLYYMSFEVIDNNWTIMKTAMEGSPQQQTVDDILQVHNQFLTKTLEACLLTNRELVQSLTKLLNTCLLFTDQMKRFMDTTKIYDDSSILADQKRVAVQRNLNERGLSASVLPHKKPKSKKKTVRRALMETKQERQALIQRQTRRVGREVMSDSYQRMVSRFDQVFSENLEDFMIQLNTATTSGLVANLGIRLDYNGFVTASMGQT